MIDATESRRNAVQLERRSEAAFLGAAIGDALGWPHEMRARRSKTRASDGGLRYEDWIKRGGGRFQGYEEQIAAGSYSDDTQLILAVARALRRNRKAWWEVLAHQELPFWTIYERGGGGATKRAASSWAQGTQPWHGKLAETRRYFEAGGNGVAMRILPHAVRRAGEHSFAPLARDVMADGVCTHGHPRALIGALVYAFAMWSALRHRGTLEFGQLIHEALSSSQEWGKLPSIDEQWRDWAEVAHGSFDVERVWDETVLEQVRLLEQAAGAINAGAASFDEETLTELGCFDPRVNGAGTVTAAGAIYLASRHAADPHEGLRAAALARGADTDTLASMTCGLLGAAVGGSWIERYVDPLQDVGAIRLSAHALLRGEGEDAELYRVNRKTLGAFTRSLTDVPHGGRAWLPIGVAASVEPWDGIVSKVSSTQAAGWRLRADDGQTYFLKVFSRAGAAAREPSRTPTPDRDLFARQQPSSDFNVGLRIAVADLARSRRFYQGLVGLAASREGRDSISFGRLALKAGKPAESDTSNFRLYIERSDLAACFERLEDAEVEIVTPIQTRGDRRHFRCIDPDGYDVEIYEVRQPSRLRADG
ncbi:ADP-ribosylglycohydrolase family protein [Sphingomonas sp. JC676]|uniref:ADP-ribosylglycohydrolase family protein n=1 Tax=Sphingomonas sp. JC676 TaxID=2768065 RepID=UPI001657A001|nr:ADP-ribosylglycohydrolase family protein [Sphingomonas sp. JC676]MBC9030785.1 ADP-ribosylglycohydrolase family protein [Sphingomonas sp. JC676]